MSKSVFEYYSDKRVYTTLVFLKLYGEYTRMCMSVNSTAKAVIINSSQKFLVECFDYASINKKNFNYAWFHASHNTKVKFR